jgi:hypothetical protein
MVIDRTYTDWVGCSERKRSQDKIYPKGYVEMLEQQQSQLVSGLKEMYHRLQKASAWDGPTLDESSGQPLTHDILSALDLLEPKHDESGETEVFEENCDKLQSRMLSEGSGFSHRRGSLSSDSEHSHHERPRTAASRHATPTQTKPSIFRESFNFPSAASSPLSHSPIPRSKQFAPQQLAQHQQPSIRPSPFPLSTYNSDPQLYAPEWAQVLAMNDPDQAYRAAKFGLQDTADLDAFNAWDIPTSQMDSYGQFASFHPQMSSHGPMFGGMPDATCPPDMSQLDNSSMEFDFMRYVQQPEVMT